MKQTAVEWYIDALQELNVRCLNGTLSWIEYSEEKRILDEQAKQMEKEQIVEAWDDAYEKGTRDRIEKISNPVGNAEQYYNETFKK